MLLAELGELVVGKFEYGTQPCEPSLEFARYLVVRLIGESMIDGCPSLLRRRSDLHFRPFVPECRPLREVTPSVAHRWDVMDAGVTKLGARQSLSLVDGVIPVDVELTFQELADFGNIF